MICKETSTIVTLAGRATFQPRTRFFRAWRRTCKLTCLVNQAEEYPLLQLLLLEVVVVAVAVAVTLVVVAAETMIISNNSRVRNGLDDMSKRGGETPVLRCKRRRRDASLASADVKQSASSEMRRLARHAKEIMYARSQCNARSHDVTTCLLHRMTLLSLLNLAQSLAHLHNHVQPCTSTTRAHTPSCSPQTTFACYF
jgi:hypothetical protein